MAIIKTSTTTRTDTSIPFYTSAGRAAIEAGNASVLPEYQKMYPTLKDMIDAGTYQIDESVSEDELTETRVLTYADLATLNRAETAYDISTAKEFQNYKITNNFVMVNASTITAEDRSKLWKLEGIDSPYTVTTTYTFPSASDAYIDTFVASLETYDHFNKLSDLIINGASVITVHQYLNSADQTANPYLDAFFIAQLAEKNVTRTVVYAMV
jgi:hypothetical protein